MMRELGLHANKKTQLIVTDVFRDGESGELVCQVKTEGADSFSAALTNLKLDITHPLYRKVKNYRDEVANTLAQPEDAPNVNSSTFRMGSLYGKALLGSFYLLTDSPFPRPNSRPFPNSYKA